MIRKLKHGGTELGLKLYDLAIWIWKRLPCQDKIRVFDIFYAFYVTTILTATVGLILTYIL